jgi:hypothetical protein
MKLYQPDPGHDQRILQYYAEREFLQFWERSICADKHYRWWLNRIMGRA